MRAACYNESVDAHSLKVLELPRVLESLASHTATNMGREAALALEPSSQRDVVARRLQETREARHLRDHGTGMPLGGIRDIRDIVRRAAVGQQLTPLELNDVAHTVEAARRLRNFLYQRVETCPLLAEMAKHMPVPQGLETRIAECIAENGEIRDTASPALARIRSDRKQVQGRLLDKLNAVLASDRFRTMLQEPIITEREGRYCVPVKAECRAQFGGIVHDISTSGATVFMEPAACVDLGNRLKELAISEEQEISRILNRLTSLVGRHDQDLSAMLAQLASLDLAHAKAVLAEHMGASEPRPADVGVVELYSARHPLLQGEVVPIDIEIGRSFDVLLLTGPNTGGKTVALKTVGLLTLMRQCGLQIPASPDSSMAIFNRVFADIGDEQDIQQSLSTFSAHLRNIVRIVQQADDESLVLLDEIGAGTDPTEGAALARAILATLQRRGARIIATTHYGELKEYAYTTDGVENAAVDFDRDTLRPTYRVLIGVPGSSHAFYIAQRLGLPAEVVAEAQNNMSARDRSAGEMMEHIERSRLRAESLEKEAKAHLRAAEAARMQYERLAREVADVRRTIRREVEEEARAVLRRATERAENIIGELRKMAKGTRKGPTARRKLAELRQEVTEALAEPPVEAEPEAAPEGHVYRVGDKVRVMTFGVDGNITALPNERTAQVQMGALRATLPLDVLRPVSEEAPTEAKPRKRSSVASAIAMQKVTSVGPEVMIRAMRVDEAHALLDRYVDDAYAAGIRQVRIIHGKGTGVLRRFVQDYLRNHPLVESQRPADETEGGAGATIAVLKD